MDVIVEAGFQSGEFRVHVGKYDGDVLDNAWNVNRQLAVNWTFKKYLNIQ